MRMTAMGLVLCVFLAMHSQAAPADDARQEHVILISIDGLPAYLINDANVPLPTLRSLGAHGAVAEGMTVSNPSVTWPNHTTLVTGVPPAEHGVLFNGMLERPGLGLPVNVNGKKDKAELVHIPTLYDVAHAQHLLTAGINWPCTRNSKTLDFDFPDVPETFEHTTPELIQDLTDAGIFPKNIVDEHRKLSPIGRDRIWTQSACHVIREKKPDLLLVHLLNLDAVHHRYGPLTWAGYSATAAADGLVREIVDAVDEAGIRNTTTFFIVSDHGFAAIPKTLRPNVLLRQAGLLTLEGSKVTSARVHVYPEGGIGMLYFTVPDTEVVDREKVLDLFRDREGIAAIVTPEEFAAYGLPQPDEYPQMADLILVAKDGYGFDASAVGDEFIVDSDKTLGTHGLLSTNPKMNATFIASGAGIKPGTKLGVINNTQVAPTIAQLLKLKWPASQGTPLEEILRQD